MLRIPKMSQSHGKRTSFACRTNAHCCTASCNRCMILIRGWSGGMEKVKWFGHVGTTRLNNTRGLKEHLEKWDAATRNETTIVVTDQFERESKRILHYCSTTMSMKKHMGIIVKRLMEIQKRRNAYSKMLRHSEIANKLKNRKAKQRVHPRHRQVKQGLRRPRHQGHSRLFR